MSVATWHDTGLLAAHRKILLNHWYLEGEKCWSKNVPQNRHITSYNLVLQHFDPFLTAKSSSIRIWSRNNKTSRKLWQVLAEAQGRQLVKLRVRADICWRFSIKMTTMSHAAQPPIRGNFLFSEDWALPPGFLDGFWYRKRAMWNVLQEPPRAMPGWDFPMSTGISAYPPWDHALYIMNSRKNCTSALM